MKINILIITLLTMKLTFAQLSECQEIKIENFNINKEEEEPVQIRRVTVDENYLKKQKEELELFPPEPIMVSFIKDGCKFEVEDLDGRATLEFTLAHIASRVKGEKHIKLTPQEKYNLRVAMEQLNISNTAYRELAHKGLSQLFTHEDLRFTNKDLGDLITELKPENFEDLETKITTQVYNNAHSNPENNKINLKFRTQEKPKEISWGLILKVIKQTYIPDRESYNLLQDKLSQDNQIKDSILVADLNDMLKILEDRSNTSWATNGYYHTNSCTESNSAEYKEFREIIGRKVVEDLYPKCLPTVEFGDKGSAGSKSKAKNGAKSH